MTSSEASPSRVGELLAGKYRVVRFMGEGGMGTVYEAQHEVVGRRFAVKFLHAQLAQHDEILERFKREARAAGALESENIASVVDFGLAADGIPYMVLRLMPVIAPEFWGSKDNPFDVVGLFKDERFIESHAVLSSDDIDELRSMMEAMDQRRRQAAGWQQWVGFLARISIVAANPSSAARRSRSKRWSVKASMCE